MVKWCTTVVLLAALTAGRAPDGPRDAYPDPYPDNKVPRGGELPYRDRCGMISQVQSTVIQMLSTHYEYGKGIHALHGVVQGIRDDVSALKSKIYELERRLANDTAAVVARPYAPKYLPLPTLDPLTFRSAAAMSRTIRALNWGMRNLTRMMETQDGQYERLERRYSALRRKLKRTVAEMVDKAKAGKTNENRYILDHFIRKQTDINSKLLHRVQLLEQKIRIQADSPYVASKHGRCPPGFVRHFTSCYLFVNKTANWIEAEKHCQRQHPKAHLVSIETSEEAEYLVRYRMHNLEHWSSSYIWTGGNDMAHENVWRWVGTGDELRYTNWRPGQPDNHNNDQHCVYYSADGADPRWDDWHCYAARLNYVCEIKVHA